MRLLPRMPYASAPPSRPPSSLRRRHVVMHHPYTNTALDPDFQNEHPMARHHPDSESDPTLDRNPNSNSSPDPNPNPGAPPPGLGVASSARVAARRDHPLRAVRQPYAHAHPANSCTCTQPTIRPRPRPPSSRTCANPLRHTRDQSPTIQTQPPTPILAPHPDCHRSFVALDFSIGSHTLRYAGLTGALLSLRPIKVILNIPHAALCRADRRAARAG